MKNLTFNKNTYFLPLFLALVAFVSIWHNNYSFELDSFDGRSIGVATAKNIDVGGRINCFYRGVLTFFVMFIASSIVFNYLYNRFKRLRKEILAINSVSFLGITLSILEILNQNTQIAKQFIFGILIIYAILIIAKIIAKSRKVDFSSIDIIWAITISISTNTFIFLISGFNSFSLFFPVLALVNLLILAFAKTKRLYINLLLAPLSTLISLLPILLLVSQESYLILNQRGILNINPLTILITISLLILGILLLHFLKYRKNQISTGRPAIKQFTFTLIGIILLSFYQPIAQTPNELFELANPAVTLMNFFEFGKLPVMDYLSAHFISDCLAGFFYFLFNGYESTAAFLVYKTLFDSFAYIMFFFFMKKTLKSNLYAGILTVLFPFVNTAVWGINGAILLLIPLCLHLIYKKPSLRNYALYFVLLFFQICWRPDTGYTAIVTMIFGLTILFILRKREMKLRLMIKSFLLIFVPIGIFLAILIFKNPIYLENIEQAIDFITSSQQARGLQTFYSKADRIFVVHHLIIPFIIFGILTYNLLKLKTLEKRSPFILFSILILSVVYLTNFQRGLTRHSYIEMGDTFVSVFAYMIISLSIIQMLKCSNAARFRLLFSTLTLLIVFFKYPESANIAALPDRFNEICKNNSFFIKSNERIKRSTIDKEYFNKNLKEILGYIENNLKDNELFFDFSNTPMLYYYSNKLMPIYFIHLVAITNDKLQEKQVEQIKRNNVPYVIYAHNPAIWWDKTDGIENSIRHYKIAEYIFQNYEPHIIVDTYRVWKKKGLETNKTNYPADTLNNKPSNMSFYRLPYVWAKFDKTSKNSEVLKKYKIENQQSQTFKIPKTIDKTTGNYIKIKISNKELKKNSAEIELKNDNISLGKANFEIMGRNNTEDYTVRISSHFNWYHEQLTSFCIKLKGNHSTIEAINLAKGD